MKLKYEVFFPNSIFWKYTVDKLILINLTQMCDEITTAGLGNINVPWCKFF